MLCLIWICPNGDVWCTLVESENWAVSTLEGRRRNCASYVTALGSGSVGHETLWKAWFVLPLTNCFQFDREGGHCSQSFRSRSPLTKIFNGMVCLNCLGPDHYIFSLDFHSNPSHEVQGILNCFIPFIFHYYILPGSQVTGANPRARTVYKLDFSHGHIGDKQPFTFMPAVC